MLSYITIRKYKMSNRALFITTVICMVDLESIFTASPEYWGDTFDAIESGETNVDQVFVTIYKTIQTIIEIQNSPTILRVDGEQKDRRMLLDALDHRLKGHSVTIMTISPSQSRYLENEFFHITDDIFSDTKMSQEQKELFDLGLLNFIVATESRVRDIYLKHDGIGLEGYQPNHKIFLTQAVFKEHFIKRNDPFISLMNKYSNDKEMSQFINRSEAVIKANKTNHFGLTKVLMGVDNTAPSQGWVFQGIGSNA